LTDDVIESGPQIVDNIANYQRPSRIVGSHFPVLNNHALPLRLVMGHERMSFLFRSSPLLDSSVQLCNVVMRTFEFVTDSSDGSTHDSAS
jgi:hypothetical protein